MSKEQLDALDEARGIEDLAYIITVVVAGAAPTIDKGETFELIHEMLMAESVDDETAATYGALIRATGIKGPAGIH